MNAVTVPTNVKITFTVIPVPVLGRAKIQVDEALFAVQDVRSALNRWYYLG